METPGNHLTKGLSTRSSAMKGSPKPFVRTMIRDSGHRPDLMRLHREDTSRWSVFSQVALADTHFGFHENECAG